MFLLKAFVRRTGCLTHTRKLALTEESMDAWMSLFGLNDANIALLERELNVRISMRGSELAVTGEDLETEILEVIMHNVNRKIARRFKLFKEKMMSCFALWLL